MDVLKELNALSIYKPLSEAEVRSIVGAPTPEEEQTCSCGEDVNTCPDAYEHMTHGA
jgi:hypothetical protein